ncbi:MAG: hypothetical protein RLZZ196_994, partial [Bacteroidota bacterium]
PWFSIWKKKKGETEYGIGWVPFGGYVKIAGMIDESMDKEQLSKPAEPYEFRSKPAWQRLIIMIGGVLVNVLLAIVIFIGITWVWGEEYLPVKNIKQGVVADSLAKTIGIQDGDNVVGIDGKPLEAFGTLESEMVLNDAKVLQVTRNDSAFDLQVPAGFIAKLAKVANETSLVMPRYPAIVDSVSSTAVFTKDALKKNDQLLAINNKPFLFYHEFDELKKGYEDSIVSLTVLRGIDTVDVRVKINEKGKLGFFGRSPLKIFGTKTKTYGFIESIPVGFNKTWETLDRYVTGIKQIFTGKVAASDSLGSVISIGNTFPGTWDWERFWTLTGIFSIILAFMNILPIPALDGGHALFTLYEMITKRKPSDKFMEYAQMVGMVLLLSLMVYALGLDFWRLFK